MKLKQTNLYRIPTQNMIRTCLNAYIEANLNASSLESTAWEAPSVKTTRMFSTGCPINEPL